MAEDLQQISPVSLSGASYRSMPEQELIRRCSDKDPRAFSELFRRYRSEVYGVIYMNLRRKEEIEDVLQEVFIEVFRSIHRFEGRSRFSTWLFRVCVNVTMRHLRKRRPNLDLPLEGAYQEVEEAERERPDDVYERKELLLGLQRALQDLSPKKRMVFILHDIQGIPAGEIAEIVGAPVLTVRTRLFYARKEILTKVGDGALQRSTGFSSGGEP